MYIYKQILPYGTVNILPWEHIRINKKTKIVVRIVQNKGRLVDDMKINGEKLKLDVCEM